MTKRRSDLAASVLFRLWSDKPYRTTRDLDLLRKGDGTFERRHTPIPADTPIGDDIPPLAEAVTAFEKALADARAAEDHLRTVLTDDGWLE